MERVPWLNHVGRVAVSLKFTVAEAYLMKRFRSLGHVPGDSDGIVGPFLSPTCGHLWQSENTDTLKISFIRNPQEEHYGPLYAYLA